MMREQNRNEAINLLAQLPRLKRVNNRKFQVTKESTNVAGRMITYTINVKSMIIHLTATYEVTWFIDGDIVDQYMDQDSRAIHLPYEFCMKQLIRLLKQIEIGV